MSIAYVTTIIQKKDLLLIEQHFIDVTEFFYLERQERVGRLVIFALPEWAVTKTVRFKHKMSFSQ